MRDITDFDKGQIVGRPTTAALIVWSFSNFFFEFVIVLEIVALGNPKVL